MNKTVKVTLYGLLCHAVTVAAIIVAAALSMRGDGGAGFTVLYFLFLTPSVLVVGACVGLLAGRLRSGVVSMMVGALMAWTIGLPLGFVASYNITGPEADNAIGFYLIQTVVSLALAAAPVVLEAGVKRLLRRYPRK